ncbi:hypothetical protein BBP00_00009379 [Phytophthora kernoviae]|uniref:GAF domain-containing protein n=1 Tax=Phytophthora kernoviae TaxID=325452 RepID=A0A3F2RCR8_9STRA|nr:hypothetical protein BBP00_00009379 [Phytophthora kernoviae]
MSAPAKTLRAIDEDESEHSQHDGDKEQGLDKEFDEDGDAEVTPNVGAEDTITVIVHVRDKIIPIHCGFGTQQVVWLGHVAIARFDEDGQTQGWLELGIPTKFVKDGKRELGLTDVICDVLQNRSHVYINTETTTSSPEDPSRKVLVDDKDLICRAQSASASVALERALAYPTNSWDSKKSTPCIHLGSSDPNAECFTLFSRMSNSAGEDNEVLATGNIVCSPQELVSVLRSSNENDYNSAMKGLYGDQFIYGSVVQVVKGGQSTQELVEVPEGHQLAVKTSCFVRSRLFARNEQWCFLEYFQPVEKANATAAPAPDAAQGFSVAFVSMSEQELAAGEAVGDRVDQLDGITALCVVEPVGDAKKVRVTFHALHTENNNATEGVATAKMTQSRLLALAEGIPRLPAVVRRRRLGTQVFADSSAAANKEAQNSRCISCTKGMRLSTLARCARRCQLCSYNVCTSCWSRENVETYNGHVAHMGFCRRCVEWVDRCDYSQVQIERHGPVQIVDDPVDNSSSPPTGNSLRESLAVENTKAAAVAVVKMLLNHESSSTKSTCIINSDGESEDEDEDEEGYMTAVQEYFQRRAHEAPAAADCVLANAEQRTYPLELVETSPSAPFPQNELARLECINTLGLMSLKDPMPELDIICSFLSKELGFFCTMITIVGERHQLVLSCTMPDLVQALLPREHTFCQHLLMGDAPFIVRNPEADVRFYNLNPVTKQGVKFYCGIPIMGPRGVMVGSVCCVHVAVMDITRSQYDTLQRFGQIASKIIQVKVEAKCSSLYAAA